MGFVVPTRTKDDLPHVLYHVVARIVATSRHDHSGWTSLFEKLRARLVRREIGAVAREVQAQIDLPMNAELAAITAGPPDFLAAWQQYMGTPNSLVCPSGEPARVIFSACRLNGAGKGFLDRRSRSRHRLRNPRRGPECHPCFVFALAEFVASEQREPAEDPWNEHFTYIGAFAIIATRVTDSDAPSPGPVCAEAVARFLRY